MRSWSKAKRASLRMTTMTMTHMSRKKGTKRHTRLMTWRMKEQGRTLRGMEEWGRTPTRTEEWGVTHRLMAQRAREGQRKQKGAPGEGARKNEPGSGQGTFESEVDGQGATGLQKGRSGGELMPGDRG